MKKSQITLFMMLGILVAGIIFFLVYITRSTSEDNNEIKKIVSAAEDKKQITSSIVACLDATTTEALVNLAEQGGVIYTSQGGFIQDYSLSDKGEYYAEYLGKKISYNIFPPKFNIGKHQSKLPEYPYTFFPYTGEENPQLSTPTTTEGYFGISTLPPLNEATGVN